MAALSVGVLVPVLRTPAGTGKHTRGILRPIWGVAADREVQPARRPHTVASTVAQGQWRDRPIRAGRDRAQKGHGGL